MKKYSVMVVRELVEFVEVTVEAKNFANAKDKAIDVVYENWESLDWKISDWVGNFEPTLVTELDEEKENE